MLLRSVAEAADRLGLRGRSLLVAVSGGIDSITLFSALDELAEELGLKLSIGHVNHGLRGDASHADQAFVERFGAARGARVETFDAAPEHARPGPSRERLTLQEAARHARYCALERGAGRVGADRIATAHTLDDQAETVLMRLLRGTGPDGLGGIPEHSTDLSPSAPVVRPLLGVSRAEIERFARSRRLNWREDSSNASPAYTRNRIRARIPDLAREFNPGLLRALADLADAQRRDTEWIEARVEQEVAARFSAVREALVIDAKDWAALPEPLARRVARAALVRAGAGRHVTRRHLERMCRFLAGAEPGKRLELPGRLTLERHREGFRLGPPC